MTLADTFSAEADRLRSIAYRIVGSPDDADDIVQDTWLRFSTANVEAIENVPAWLTTVTSRLAIDRLRSAANRRETYVGPWLSSPLANVPDLAEGPDDLAVMAESLTLGFLSVLERLGPIERTVFVLHDVFGYPLAQIADVLDRSHDATRQTAKRARDRVQRERPRFDPDPADATELAQLLMAAAWEGDVDTLASYLAEDVVHLSDGGPNRRAARAPIVGRDRVARFFIGLAKKMTDSMELHITEANGQPAIYLTDNGEPYMLEVSNWIDGKLVASFAVLNPDKLAAFHRTWQQA